MPKRTTSTGESVNVHGKDPRKLTPLICQKDAPIPMPTWDAYQAASPQGRGFVRSFQATLNDGVVVLQIVETGFNTDAWELRLQMVGRIVKFKQIVKGEAVAKFRIADIARERCLRAAHAADMLACMSIPF